MKEVIVIFHRAYPVPIELIKERSHPHFEDLDRGDIVGYAEEIARDWLSDEMQEFCENTEDFVSATTEIIEE